MPIHGTENRAATRFASPKAEQTRPRELLEEVTAELTLEGEIEHDHARLHAIDGGAGGLQVGALDWVEARIFERAGDRLAEDQIVFEHERRRQGGAAMGHGVFPS